MAKNRFPDFLVIGAGKSGTTSLNEYLKEHPQIFMSHRKEPNFFAFEMVDPEQYELESSRLYHYQSVTELSDYLALFDSAKPGQLLGEVSNTYLSSELACERIKHYIPEAKLIAILRNPAERLFSRYYHLVRVNEVSVEWEQLYDKNSEWWKRQDLIDEGFYYAHLKPYYEAFDSSQILLITYDRFVENTNEVMQEIFQFLGFKVQVEIATDVVYNKSGKVKNKMLDAVVGHNSFLIKGLKGLAPKAHHYLKENYIAKRFIHTLRNNNVEKPDLSEENRREITDEIYREDLEKLMSLTKLDIKRWLN